MPLSAYCMVCVLSCIQANYLCRYTCLTSRSLDLRTCFCCFLLSVCVVGVMPLLPSPFQLLGRKGADEPRPSPVVRPAPYQVRDVRPQLHDCRPLRSVIPCRFKGGCKQFFSSTEQSVPASSSGSARIAARPPPPSIASVPVCNMSGPMREDAERKRLALALVGLVHCLQSESSVLSAMPGYSADQLLFLFLDRAPSTLKRHLSGWRRWAEFCRCSNIAMGEPACPHVLGFLEALAEGSRSNRKGVVHALGFVAYKLDLKAFLFILQGPIVNALLPRRGAPGVFPCGT